MDDVITDSVGDVIVQVDKNQYFFEFCIPLESPLPWQWNNIFENICYFIALK